MQDYMLWYLENKPKYEIFVSRMADLIETLLNNEGISYLKVQHRIKDFRGFHKKNQRT